MSEGQDDDFEEIIPEPQVKIGEQAAFAGLLRCKRKADQFSGSGKRQKVFENDGAEYLVDAELLRSLNPNMELEELDDVEEEMDDEDKEREAERMAHAYRSAAKLYYAAQTKTLTVGMRKHTRTLRKQNITPDDVEFQLANDIEEFNWVAVPSPWVALTHKFIGKHSSKENCYGCERGIGIERVDSATITELRTLITDLIPRSNIGLACLQIEIWFDQNIKDPFNTKLRKGENAIQSWSANSIFEHVRSHCKESSFLHAEMLEALHEHLRIVRYRSLYRTRVETLRSGRELAIWDIRPSRDGHKMLLETIKAITDLESKDPRLMHNHNPKFSVASHYMGGVGTKVVGKKAIEMKAVYDTMNTGL